MQRTPSAKQAGFSLLEIIIAVSVIAILAGVISLRSGNVIDSARATKVVGLANTLKLACASYHADTGTYAREYAGSSIGNRRLSGTQTVTGWNGPYIEAPLSVTGTNPYGGRINVYDRPNASSVSGFDIDGDGIEDVTTLGNIMYLDSVEDVEAKRIDNLMDAGLGGTWGDSGRVRYDAPNKRLLILIYF